MKLLRKNYEALLKDEKWADILVFKEGGGTFIDLDRYPRDRYLAIQNDYGVGFILVELFNAALKLGVYLIPVEPSEEGTDVNGYGI